MDISLIQTSARNNLINLLEKCPGKKAIVWDNNLAGPVGLVAQYTILREHMVTKMYPLRPTALPETDVDHVIFISRPKLHLMDYIGNYTLNLYVFINRTQCYFQLRMCVQTLKLKAVLKNSTTSFLYQRRACCVWNDSNIMESLEVFF